MSDHRDPGLGRDFRAAATACAAARSRAVDDLTSPSSPVRRSATSAPTAPGSRRRSRCSAASWCRRRARCAPAGSPGAEQRRELARAGGRRLRPALPAVVGPAGARVVLGILAAIHGLGRDRGGAPAPPSWWSSSRSGEFLGTPGAPALARASGCGPRSPPPCSTPPAGDPRRADHRARRAVQAAAARVPRRRARATHGTTLLLTTHDMGDVERLCDRVLLVDRGRLAFDGTLAGLSRTVGAQRVLVVDLAAAEARPRRTCPAPSTSAARAAGCASGWPSTPTARPRPGCSPPSPTGSRCSTWRSRSPTSRTSYAGSTRRAADLRPHEQRHALHVVRHREQVEGAQRRQRVAVLGEDRDVAGQRGGVAGDVGHRAGRRRRSARRPGAGRPRGAGPAPPGRTARRRRRRAPVADVPWWPEPGRFRRRAPQAAGRPRSG